MGWRSDIASLQDGVRTTQQQLTDVLDQLSRRFDSLAEKTESGFTELRDQNRELRQALAQAQADLSVTQRDAERARAAAEAAQHELDEARRIRAAVAPTENSESDGDHEALLALAAGIASAELVCHRDTWAFMVEQASRGEHFRLPAELSEGPEGAVEVDVSGRTLIAALDALWTVRWDPATSAGSRHLAWLVYQRIGAALGRVRPMVDDTPEERDQEPPRSERTRIVIDDRPAVESAAS